jgi:Glycosyltransferase family 87
MHKSFKYPIVLYLTLVIVVLAHLAIVTSILTQRRPIIWPLHNDTIHRIGPGSDFYAIYHGGVNLRRGVSPYHSDADGRTPFSYPYRYLPAVALSAQLLTLLPPRVAYLLWIGFLECLLGAFVFTLYKRLENKALWLFLTALLLLNSPYFLEIYTGQSTFAATALTALAIMASGGVILYSLAVLLKVFPLVALPALMKERRYWLQAITAVVLVVLTSLIYFTIHPRDFNEFVSSNFGSTFGHDSGNFGFLRLIDLLVSDLQLAASARHWNAFVTTFSLLILIGVTLIVWLSKSRDVVLGACALLLAHFIAYQHVWEHHLSAVVLIGCLLMTIKSEMRGWKPIVLTCLVLLALPTPYFFFDTTRDPNVWDPAVSWPHYASYLVILPKVIPTLALFTLCLTKLLQAGLVDPWTMARSRTV